MDQDRRTFVWHLTGLLVGGAMFRPGASLADTEQETGTERLEDLLRGTWSLKSYTYTSNNRTYSSPDEMEATAKFDEAAYSVEFATYISAVGIQRTRRASESGTFSVEGDRVLLNADEASEEGELGEETLTDVRIEGGVLSLVSNNGITNEVWEKVVD